jgi:uncharacterized protein
VPATVQRTSKPQPGLPADFYAPGFEIEVEGRKLGPESLGDIHEVKVVMDLEGVDSFELSLDNWDDSRVDFKHIRSMKTQSPPLFDIGHRVRVRMGYAGRLLWMVVGQVTALAPHFPQSGPRTLTVSGLGGLFKMRDHKRSPEPYRDKADWEIAQAVAERNHLRARVTPEGPKHERVVQRDQDDAEFLKERARRIGFDFYMRTDPVTGEETLVFVRAESGETTEAPVYVFEWGRSLISFSPAIDISRQVGQVTLRSWDPATKSVLTHVARPADLPSGRGRNGPAMVEVVRKGKEDLIEDAPVLSAEEGRELAISRLRERAYAYCTGSGQAIGLPDLRPGDFARIDGVGLLFSGFYQVIRVEHTINASGYLTSFNVRRTHDGGTGA